MKLSCLQENLNRGLSVVGRAVAVRATLPVTNNVLLTTDQSRLKLVATNLEMAISCWIGAKVEEEGSITVPARLITEFINVLPNDRVDINLDVKTLELKCARSEARISGIDASEFPPIPGVEDGVVTSVDAEKFRQALSQVVFAAATEESRPVLTGVDALFEGGELTLASADGFRLAVYKMPLLAEVPERLEAIIPAKTLSELVRLMGDQKDAVEITISQQKGQILFKLKNIELVSQLVQGNFPKYTQLIPESNESRVELPVGEFLRAVKTASIFARDGSGIVKLVSSAGESELQPGKLVISARSEEVGENIGEMDVTVTGKETKIAFNGKYLIDVLSVLKEETVALETSSSSSPGVLRPIGADNYTHVVMPMFVQW